MSLVAGVAALVIAGAVFADYWSAVPREFQATYVGRDACITCHVEEAERYQGSHHDLAMDVATERSVLGDFNDATIEHDGIVSRMYRDGDRFMIRTEGETGALEDFEVKYVFGYEPLQQYMVEFDRQPDMKPGEIARLQVLRISWDTAHQRWFYLRPPDVADKLSPDDPLHWTGIAQRWQTMCAECHSTNLKRNYDPATTEYHTTFSEIDVSCEACHGPGSLHIELANSTSLFWDRNHGYGLARLKGDDAEPQLQACAPCHSRRGVLSTDYQAGDNFYDHFQLELLRPQTYHADGQIKDEVYVFGSFVQSRMYHKGIRCTDCHDPHSLELKAPGNQTCTSCHQHAAGKYDVPSHHHHQPGTPGAMCVNCHMPHTTYMAVDPRRDHSLRIPRPDLSVRLKTPNACSGCHVKDREATIDAETRENLNEYADWLAAAEAGDAKVSRVLEETDRWCDDACQKWYGSNRRTDPHFAEALVAFRKGDPAAMEALLKLLTKPDEAVPPIAKASVLGELGLTGFPADPEVAAAFQPVILDMLNDPFEHPTVRAAAIGLFSAPQRSEVATRGIREALLPLVDDSSRLVRTEAARALVGSNAYRFLTGREQAQVDRVMKEVRESLMAASDRSGAHLSWGILCQARGQFEEAVEAYKSAIRVEPTTTGPRTNLAELYETYSAELPPEQRQAYQDEADKLRLQELPLLGRDAKLAADNAHLQYRYGLALYLSGKWQEARAQLQTAVRLAPDVEVYRTVLQLLEQKIAETAASDE